MKTYLVTAPTSSVLTAAELRTFLPGLGDVADATLEAWAAAVAATLDPASGGWLGRALRPQTWELRMDGFPACDGIRLPYPPVTSIASVKYDDANGVEQTLALNTGYRVIGLGDAWKTLVTSPYGGSWPTARSDPESVRIRYVAGYALTPADVMPQSVKSAIALGVQLLRSNTERNLYLAEEEQLEALGRRRWVVSDAASGVMQRLMEGQLAGLRVYY